MLSSCFLLSFLLTVKTLNTPHIYGLCLTLHALGYTDPFSNIIQRANRAFPDRFDALVFL